MKEKVKKDKSKKVTISEFKIWLDGISTFQAEDWTPNAQQWQVIKDKIECLVDDTKIIQNTIVQNRVRQEATVVETSDEDSEDNGEVGYEQEQQPQVQQPPASRLHGPIPIRQSSLMAQPSIEQVSQRSVHQPNGGGSSGQVFKTGHIDSSGGYKSGF